MTASPTLAAVMLGGNTRHAAGRSRNALIRNGLLIIAGTVFIALAAQLAIRLPFSPVPITGQTFAVLIIGMAYGARPGAATAAAYMVAGFFFPVFAEARTWAHPLTLWTAGYLVGFIAAAYVTGRLAEMGWDRRPITTALAMLAGNAAIYIPGMAWLALMYAANTDMAGGALLTTTLYSGFGVFVPGDILKLALAVVAFPMAWKFLRRK